MWGIGSGADIHQTAASGIGSSTIQGKVLV
jgi:hypothetical protein